MSVRPFCFRLTIVAMQACKKVQRSDFALSGLRVVTVRALGIWTPIAIDIAIEPWNGSARFDMSAPHASRVGGAGGHGSVIPEAFGVAIPSNPQDLLLLIQKQHKKNVHKINKHTDVISRAQKQEQQRESYENRLMEFEDFMYKPEGAERLNRQFEHIRM
jgi:hypothetical protein